MDSNLRMQSFVQEFAGDLTTPVSAFQRLRPLGARFLLESVEGGERSSRYSFVGLGAAARVWADAEGTWSARPGSESTSIAASREDPLDAMIRFARDHRSEPDARVPRLLGGLVGYIAYDYVRHLERLGTRPDGIAVPTLAFELVNEVLIFDHLQHRLHLAVLAEEGDSRASDRIDQVRAALSGPEIQSVLQPPGQHFLQLMEDDRYLEAVVRLQDHIRAGDIFQAVLSREVEVLHSPCLFEVYRALRRISPSPYMFFLEFGDVCLAGSSPESAVRLTGRRASLRPIAGTRPRGTDEESDLSMERELRESAKEQAEHAMLVDLARNDLARVATPGSVRVRSLAQVERFSHVMHLVSDVDATLDATCTGADLIRATFPAGTVSGAPKIRAMQLIDELETTPRNLYGGCMGYIGSDGAMDMALTIRSAMRIGGRTTIRAGAGIVVGSTPEAELAECRAKLGGLMAAFEEAAGRTPDRPHDTHDEPAASRSPIPTKVVA
ncbi:MAG: anthranilate synthase component I family protein [Planctomycetes bacterium]|nr:anthranilate synthase component I family protein [Planctomycetota bacterium]MBI3832931.1 anthranilate synthase component I family protein [Planctomycetota bacterium]